MPKGKPTLKLGTVSNPTLCLKCHLVNHMKFVEVGWECQKCGFVFLVKYWIIKPFSKRGKKLAEVA